MNKAIKISVGIGMIQISLWGGSYLQHQYTMQDWQSMPICMTSLMLMIAGVATTVWGFA